MTLKKTDIAYSEPVQEIMGNPPGRILRRGTTVIFVILLLFILFAWFIRYPDLIPSPVEITTENPPVTMVSKVTGKIKHLFVSDKDHVEKGKVLAVMETAASFDEAGKLRRYVDTLDVIIPRKEYQVPPFTELGELQSHFSIYLKCINDLSIFVRNDYYGIKIQSAKDEIAGLKRYVEQLKVNERLMNENLVLDLNRYRRDSLLNSGKSIAPAEYERSKQVLNNQRIELQLVRLQVSEKNIEYINRQQLINEYTATRSEQMSKLLSAAEESFRNLKAQLKIWENTYLLVSPIAGTVTFTRFWSINQTVSANDPVMSVVPSVEGSYVGRIYLKMQRSGKVQTGQTVNIKFSGYPYLEYGMVQGVVRKKALVPSGDAYIIEIDLPNGLRTLYNKELAFTQNMQGTAEILTDDRSLLEKMVSPFRYLLSKNKR